MFIKKYGSRAAGLSLVAIVLLAVQPLSAQTSSESARLEKLERAVEQLQERNAELEQEVKSLKKQTAVAPKVDPSGNKKPQIASDGKTSVEKNVATEEKSPVYVIPAGPEFKLVLGGFIQVNSETGAVSAFEGRFPGGPNAVDDRFRLRRGRLKLSGEFAEQFDFMISGDFSQGNGLSGGRTGFSGTDIFVNWHQFPEANIKAGQFKAPFGLEQLTSDTIIFTIERSLPTGAITPDRQIGVQVWGKPLTNLWPEQKDLVTYYAGIFNSNGANTNTNDNNNFMYAGRLELLPWQGKVLGQDSSLKLGADIFNSRDDTGVNISPAGNLFVNADGSLTPYNLPSPDERTAWSVDAWLTLGPFDLIGEYIEEHVDSRVVAGMPAAFSSFVTNGYYAQGSYFIIPKKLQAAVKWESTNPGQVNDDDIRSITAGVNYYIHGDSIKLMGNYIHTWSDFRAANPQFGADEFDEVVLRLQVVF